MKTNTVRAALAVCLLSSAACVLTMPAFAMGDAPTSSAPPPSHGGSTDQKVSSAVSKLLAPAQKLMQANDFAGALVLIKQAQALPDQTPFDTYEINNFLANAAIATKDYATAYTAYAAMANSPAMPDGEKSATLHNAALLAGQSKDYANAIKYGQAFNALGGPPDPTINAIMAQAYYFTNDYTNAEAMAQKALDNTPAGQAPNQAALEIMLGSQIKAKQQDQAMLTLEKIVTYYDDADDWGQIVDVSMGIKGIKEMEVLDLYRLRFLAKASAQDMDYNTASGVAVGLGYPVEAQGFLDSGGKANADIRGKAAKDRASMAGFEALVKNSGTGDLELKLAETYYGYGRYADAEAAARAALAAGGAKMNANEANMVLGQALIQQGKTADAIAAFNAISNPTPGMAKAQHVWLLWANRKTATPAAH
ncbi:MAG TPA: tetratricopeptide repeat protein [Rhizomicrobium sp.]|jgi:tetratricopeptide (TPR) repeat protein|nr:tetratricopeptide repeat protein [Rhizomicrobium sp.]